MNISTLQPAVTGPLSSIVLCCLSIFIRRIRPLRLPAHPVTTSRSDGVSLPSNSARCLDHENIDGLSHPPSDDPLGIRTLRLNCGVNFLNEQTSGDL
jgi:hypothetical protein